MQARGRRRLPLGAALLAGGLLGFGALAPALAQSVAPITSTDARGDAVVDPVGEAIAAPRADIVSTTAAPGPEGITLTARMDQAADPRTDPSWAGMEGLPSYLTWKIDLNGDGESDLELEYSVEPEEATLLGFLAPSASSFEPPAGCDPAARFSPAEGHSLLVDPKCLGNPARFSYQVEMFYNTDATNDEAAIATDHSPDTGWAGPVAVVLPAGVTPGTLPPNPTPTTSRAPASPEATSPTPAGPSAAPDRPQRAATDAGPSRSDFADRAEAGSAGGETDPAGSPGAAVPAALDLARTGLTDGAVRLARVAVGLGLVGVGLLVGTRRPSLG